MSIGRISRECPNSTRLAKVTNSRIPNRTRQHEQTKTTRIRLHTSDPNIHHFCKQGDTKRDRSFSSSSILPYPDLKKIESIAIHSRQPQACRTRIVSFNWLLITFCCYSCLFSLFPPLQTQKWQRIRGGCSASWLSHLSSFHYLGARLG